MIFLVRNAIVRHKIMHAKEILIFKTFELINDALVVKAKLSIIVHNVLFIIVMSYINYIYKYWLVFIPAL
jgi:hypothetical protein